MSEVFFEQMGIPKPDIQLDIKDGKPSEKIGKLISDLKEIIADKKYEGVIVFGDINSTLAGAIAASTNLKKLIHIEAGLRSHDRRMPEEINRVITDHLSDLLFVTEQSGLDNLLLEGVSASKMVLVGNIMVESIEIFRKTFDGSSALDDLALKAGQYVVATIHRIENTNDKQILIKLLKTLNVISEKYKVVLPLHPGTKKFITEYGLSSYLKPLLVIEPVGYIDFMKLVMDSKGVMTDSGGIQEETSYLGVPCCTLRDNTERPVTVTLGTNKLFPIETLDPIVILEHLENGRKSKVQIPHWDGEVSKRILELL